MASTTSGIDKLTKAVKNTDMTAATEQFGTVSNRFRWMADNVWELHKALKATREELEAMGINMLEEAWNWAWGTEDGGPTGGANPQLTAIEGQIISLVSDAGTPTISDPGAILVNECIKNNIDVIPLPGASAVTTAISASGFSDKYFFYGFFPEKEKNLKENLNFLSELNACIVFFISPRKINKIIPHIKKYFVGMFPK